jgi:hypothetical protein
LLRSLHQTQRQVDREFNRVLRQIKTQRSRLEKASRDLQKRFSKKTAAKKTAAKKKTASKKKTAAKRKKA